MSYFQLRVANKEASEGAVTSSEYGGSRSAIGCLAVADFLWILTMV